MAAHPDRSAPQRSNQAEHVGDESLETGCGLVSIAPEVSARSARSTMQWLTSFYLVDLIRGKRGRNPLFTKSYPVFATRNVENGGPYLLAARYPATTV